MRGRRIQLAADIEAAGTRHKQGDQGTVQGSNPDGYLTARMDDGRTQFPHISEIEDVD